MVETLTYSSIVFFVTPKQVHIICFPNNEFQSFQKILFNQILTFSPIFSAMTLAIFEIENRARE